MKQMAASEVQKTLFRLIDEVTREGQPILVKGDQNNVVLLSEQCWKEIKETLHLSSVPGLKDDLIEGSRKAVGDCHLESDLDW